MLNMAAILDGLTGGLDLDVLDTGYGLRDGHMVSYAPKARRFGAVLPANSPGVHALWLPAFALKMPLALKPGQREPWTPLRIMESLRGRIPGGGDWVLSFGARRGRRHSAEVRRGNDVRLGRVGAAVAGRPADRDSRSRLQQGAARTRQGRCLARLPRSDRHIGLVQRRPIVHQRLERADSGSRPRIGRGLGPATGGDPAALARRRCRPCWRRFPIRPRPAASMRRSSEGWPRAAPRTSRLASADPSDWSSSRAARTCCRR